MAKIDSVFTGRALARKHNISEGTIRKAYNRGELFRIKSGRHKGKYDMSDVRNKEGITNILRNMQSGTKLPREHKIEKKKVIKENVQQETEIKNTDSVVDSETVDVKVVSYEDFEISNKKIDTLSLSDIRLLKDREILREKQIKNQKARGELVDKKEVANIFNKLWSVDTSQFVTLATKIAPEVASICEVEDQEIITNIRKKIDDEIWRILGSCRRIMNDYLGKIGEGELKDESNI